MIALTEILITFAALLALCLFLHVKTGLPSGAAPLFVLCGTMVWYSVWGSVRLLVPAGALWFGAALAAAPIIIVFLIFQKYFTQGITMGAVKG